MILADGESSIPPKISTFSLSISESIEIAFDSGILLELATLNGKKDIGSAKSNLDNSFVAQSFSSSLSTIPGS